MKLTLLHYHSASDGQDVYNQIKILKLLINKDSTINTYAKYVAICTALKIDYTSEITYNLYFNEFSFGDRVEVIDGSGNKDKDTLKRRDEIDPLFRYIAIVIGVNQKEEYVSACNNVYLLDLLLAFPTGEQVYCSSNLVRKFRKTTIIPCN